jgi:hypothetical protein
VVRGDDSEASRGAEQPGEGARGRGSRGTAVRRGKDDVAARRGVGVGIGQPVP